MFDNFILCPECPSFDTTCPYLGKDGICYMAEHEGVPPYLECDAWEGSDEAEELISMRRGNSEEDV